MKNSFFENRYNIAALVFLWAILYAVASQTPHSFAIITLAISGMALIVIAETTTPIPAAATLNFSEKKDSWGENLKHAGNVNPPEAISEQPKIEQQAAPETLPTETKPEVEQLVAPEPEPEKGIEADELKASPAPINHEIIELEIVEADNVHTADAFEMSYAKAGDHIPHGFDSTTRRIYADIHQFATAAKQPVTAIENKIRSWGHRYEILPAPTAHAHAFVIHRDGVPSLRIPHLEDSYFLTA